MFTRISFESREEMREAVLDQELRLVRPTQPAVVEGDRIRYGRVDTRSTRLGTLSVAKETIVKLVDDIDGSTADQTVMFALDGVMFEIDLSDENAVKLRQTLKPFVEAGTRVTADGTRHTRTVISAEGASLREETRAIRAWGQKYGPQLGLDAVGDRGAIPQRVREAYEKHDGRAPRTALASPFLAPNS